MASPKVNSPMCLCCAVDIYIVINAYGGELITLDYCFTNLFKKHILLVNAFELHVMIFATFCRSCSCIRNETTNVILNSLGKYPALAVFS
jgi:hypothetical protein